MTPSDEPLVPVGSFSSFPSILTSSIYYGEHDNSPYKESPNRLSGALITMFVREEVAHQLSALDAALPPHHHLLVLDAYRPLEVQQSLYDFYLSSLRKISPHLSEEELAAQTQKYVSIPSSDPTRPSPHNTGGAIDMAIVTFPPEISAEIRGIQAEIARLSKVVPPNPTPYEEAYNQDLQELYLAEMRLLGLVHSNASLMDYGTPFDHGDGEAAAAYLESTHPQSSQASARRLLHHAAVEAGLAPYADEWWHFNSPKTQMGAFVTGQPVATYGAAELSPANLRFEQMRRAHHQGLALIAAGVRTPELAPDRTTADLIELNLRALERRGSPTATALPKAAVIAPSSM